LLPSSLQTKRHQLHKPQLTYSDWKIMEEEGTNKEAHRRLVALLVRSYVAHNVVGADQLAALISEVHQSIAGLGKDRAPQAALVPAVPVKRSVQPDFVVCLECGFRSKMLRRHLRGRHGLEAANYRARWRLSADHPLTAPRYSEHRSAVAKQLGLGHHSRPADPSPFVLESTAVAKRRGRKPRQPAAASPEVTTAPAPKRRGPQAATTLAAK
jgi:predicted transcriptional regulator